jgi:dCTP deaminase
MIISPRVHRWRQVPEGDYHGAHSKIQAASLDLTIGNIHVPGTEDDRPGGAFTPLTEYALSQGHTAVLRTRETLNLGPKLAGIAFPPATLSLKGLLMTNPGHIDPGYRGHLHLTVINMSRESFPLRRGDRICRVLLIPLNEKAEAPYNDRHPGVRPSPITSELLGRLSVDFVDVEARAENCERGSEKGIIHRLGNRRSGSCHCCFDRNNWDQLGKGRGPQAQ